jgi:hypothetical protein
MRVSRIGLRRITACLAFSFLSAVSIVSAEDAYNLTGLPLYPNLRRAEMDKVARTDALGHWCIRLAAESFDSLDVVEDWYRKTLAGASETDLNHDERYRNYPQLSGIKLSIGINSVTVFRAANQSTTSIELFRCSPPGK